MGMYVCVWECVFRQVCQGQALISLQGDLQTDKAVQMLHTCTGPTLIPCRHPMLKDGKDGREKTHSSKRNYVTTLSDITENGVTAGARPQ